MKATKKQIGAIKKTIRQISPGMNYKPIRINKEYGYEDITYFEIIDYEGMVNCFNLHEIYDENSNRTDIYVELTFLEIGHNTVTLTDNQKKEIENVVFEEHFKNRKKAKKKTKNEK